MFLTINGVYRCNHPRCSSLLPSPGLFIYFRFVPVRQEVFLLLLRKKKLNILPLTESESSQCGELQNDVIPMEQVRHIEQWVQNMVCSQRQRWTKYWTAVLKWNYSFLSQRDFSERSTPHLLQSKSESWNYLSKSCLWLRLQRCHLRLSLTLT